MDKCFRFGSEEFTAIIIGVHSDMAIEIAERIKDTFREHIFYPTVNGEKIAANTTISIGVADYHFDENMQEFIERADEAMYRAKREGGNRVLSDDVK